VVLGNKGCFGMTKGNKEKGKVHKGGMALTVEGDGWSNFFTRRIISKIWLVQLKERHRKRVCGTRISPNALF